MWVLQSLPLKVRVGAGRSWHQWDGLRSLSSEVLDLGRAGATRDMQGSASGRPALLLSVWSCSAPQRLWLGVAMVPHPGSPRGR